MAKYAQQQLSSKLFYRVYFVLVFCIILIGTFLDSFISQTEIKQDSQYLKKLYKPTFVLISNELQKTDQNLWQVKIQQVSKQLNMAISLYHINDFANNQDFIKSLSNTNIIDLYGENDLLSLYMKLVDSPYIIEIEALKLASNASMKWIPIAFYLLIALVIFFLVQPFAKQLLQLRTAAIQFGKGDFSTRITMPKNSTLYPITNAFDSMTQEIETLMIRQRDLTNAVSHELRTPLARLKFAFELLDSQTTDNTMLENINHMREDVEELEVLINEMLCYAEANQIKDLSYDDIFIVELFKTISHELKPNGIKTSIDINKNIDPNTKIQGDGASLIRALSNILRNSISFAESSCHITVTNNGGTIIIQISDDGPGIDGKFKNHLFEPFYKINHVKRKSGTGLGLAIANTIIKKHKGTITIVNGKLSGACFEIRIPIA